MLDGRVGRVDPPAVSQEGSGVTHATKLQGAQAALAAIESGEQIARWAGGDYDRHQRALDHLLADLREQGSESA